MRFSSGSLFTSLMVTLYLSGCTPDVKLEIEAVEPDDSSEDSGGPDEVEDTGEEQEEEPVDGDGDGRLGAEDCDDTDPTVYVGAPEVCDGVDDDCNDLIDDAVADAPTWYVDADGDTFGDATTAVQACEAPPGHIADAGDCDDSKLELNPAGTETCGDTVDQDCDGADEVCPPFVGLSCLDTLRSGHSTGDGWYELDPEGTGTITTYCDMTTDSGGWTLVVSGLANDSAELRTDAAVGVMTGADSARLARSTIVALAYAGETEIRYGHPDYGYLYLANFDLTEFEVGSGEAGYGVPLDPNCVALSHGGTTYPGSRFGWPPNSFPAVCTNVDGGSGECGSGIHLGEWFSDEPDGVYRNDRSDIGAAHYDQVFEIWVR